MNARATQPKIMYLPKSISELGKCVTVKGHLLLVDEALVDFRLWLVELSFYDCPGKSMQCTLNVNNSTSPAVEEIEMLVRHAGD